MSDGGGRVGVGRVVGFREEEGEGDVRQEETRWKGRKGEREIGEGAVGIRRRRGYGKGG